MFPTHLAVGIEALDAEVLHRRVAVHRRAPAGLVDDQQPWRQRQRAAVRVEPVEDTVVGFEVSEDAETGIGPRVQAGAVVDQIVLAVAEVGEVLLGDPAQEREILGQFVGVERRRILLDLGDDLEHAVAHRQPVGDSAAHLLEHRQDLVAQRVEHRRLGLPVDLEVHHRLVVVGLLASDRLAGERDALLGIALDAEYRVHDQVAGEVVAVDRHAHRVDQKGHVVAGEVDDGVGRLPAVLLELGVVDVQFRHAALAAAQQVEVSQGGTVEVGRVAFGEVGGRGPSVVVTDEVAEQLALLRGDLVVDQLDQAVEDTLVLGGGALGHDGDLVHGRRADS